MEQVCASSHFVHFPPPAPPSFSSKTLKMQNILREICSREGEDITRFVDESFRAVQQETPEGHRKRQEMAHAIMELAHTPPTTLHPQLHDLQRLAMTMISQADEIDKGNPPPELVARWRKCHDQLIEESLVANPRIRDMQHELDALLCRNSESGKFKFGSNKFNMPALLNSCAKELGRPQLFTLIEFYSPTKDDLTSHLVDLHTSKPALHMQVMAILIRASLHQATRHPVGCTCVLCAHMANLMPLLRPELVLHRLLLTFRPRRARLVKQRTASHRSVDLSHAAYLPGPIASSLRWHSQQ